MRKHNSISFILVCIIAVSVILFCKAVYEDEDSLFETLCNTNDLSLYAEFFAFILLCSGILYADRAISLSPQSVIAYLARHEKSPPGNSSILKTA
jgi:hypothetical protein